MPWYPYQNLGDGVPRPYLALWQDPAIKYVSIIDSGADESCVPLSIAQAWNVPFDPSQVQIGRGVSGPHQQWHATGDIVLQCVAGPLVLHNPGIIDGLPVILIGRRDGFAQYLFTFDQRRLLFMIEPHPPEPAPAPPDPS